MIRPILIALLCVSILASDGAHTDLATGIGTAVFPLLDPGSALRLGINMGNMLEAPEEGDWSLRLRPEYIDQAKQAGFDFVRLPIRWNAHTAAGAPYTVSPSFFARIDEVVGCALQD